MENIKKKVTDTIIGTVKTKVGHTIIEPLNTIIDQNISDIVTTVGSFVVRSIRGKFQRSITFSIGLNYADSWMEEALYGILYKYNNIKCGSRLELTNKNGYNDGTGMYYRLDSGTHNLKYRNYEILLVIQSDKTASVGGRISTQRIYTIITYDLSPDFVRDFERDMINHRNSLLKIKSDAPTVTVYQDLHEGDGYTYWERVSTINKRKLNTIYIPNETKRIIVNTINEFFANKEYYKRHGIAHNLKILMYGPPGTGKDSIAKMIASEWSRNIYYCTGGKDGRFIPNAITDNSSDINYPLFLISDIDKYPFLINEPEVTLDEDAGKNDKMHHKQDFGNMINALDGILSGEDRIIVMTTNHIEKFSETILRPGRIDLKLNINYVTPEVFRKYVYDFYNTILPDDIKIKDDITVAKMQSDVVFMKMNVDEFLDKYLIKK